MVANSWMFHSTSKTHDASFRDQVDTLVWTSSSSLKSRTFSAWTFASLLFYMMIYGDAFSSQFLLEHFHSSSCHCRGSKRSMRAELGANSSLKNCDFIVFRAGWRFRHLQTGFTWLCTLLCCINLFTKEMLIDMSTNHRSEWKSIG